MSFVGEAPVTARCVPRIKLFAETLFVEDGTEVTTGMIRLDFDYANRRVRSRDVRFAGRDRAAELEAARILEGFGAVELAHLDDCAVAPGTGADYVLAVDGDPHALTAFAAHAVPQLRALGWSIT